MRRIRRDRSGQVLILAALAIAFMISSVMIYVYQTSGSLEADRPFMLDSFVRNVKIGTRNLMIGSLANVSAGGSNETLRNNLERWESFLEARYYLGECSFSFELWEDNSYSSGIRLFWGENGLGVSSAKADFSLNLTDGNGEMSMRFSFNITSHLIISAVSKWKPPPGEQQINVTIHLFNEGSPALAGNITVYYKDKSGEWNDAGLLDSYVLDDYGNGTYIASFRVPPPPVDNREIRVEVYDQREIYIEAITRAEDI